MLAAKKHIEKKKLKQREAAELFSISRPAISDLVNGKIEKFSIDKLVTMLGRAGTPTDNPQAESFMKTKYEEVYVLDYDTLSDVRNRLPRFLDIVYNQRRIHSALGYKTPEEFEQQYASGGVK